MLMQRCQLDGASLLLSRSEGATSIEDLAEKFPEKIIRDSS